MIGWGKSARWPTIAEALDAARGRQAYERSHSGNVREVRITRCRTAGGYNLGYNREPGAVVARLLPDGTVRYGR